VVSPSGDGGRVVSPREGAGWSPPRGSERVVLPPGGRERVVSPGVEGRTRATTLPVDHAGVAVFAADPALPGLVRWQLTATPTGRPPS
jgi:hypothetical protein